MSGSVMLVNYHNQWVMDPGREITTTSDLNQYNVSFILNTYLYIHRKMQLPLFIKEASLSSRQKLLEKSKLG